MKILTIILNKCVISPAKSSKRECQFEDLAKFVLEKGMERNSRRKHTKTKNVHLEGKWEILDEKLVSKICQNGTSDTVKFIDQSQTKLLIAKRWFKVLLVDKSSHFLQKWGGTNFEPEKFAGGNIRLILII